MHVCSDGSAKRNCTNVCAYASCAALSGTSDAYGCKTDPCDRCRFVFYKEQLQEEICSGGWRTITHWRCTVEPRFMVTSLARSARHYRLPCSFQIISHRENEYDVSTDNKVILVLITFSLFRGWPQWWGSQGRIQSWSQGGISNVANVRGWWGSVPVTVSRPWLKKSWPGGGFRATRKPPGYANGSTVLRMHERLNFFLNHIEFCVDHDRKICLFSNVLLMKSSSSSSSSFSTFILRFKVITKTCAVLCPSVPRSWPLALGRMLWKQQQFLDLSFVSDATRGNLSVSKTNDKSDE